MRGFFVKDLIYSTGGRLISGNPAGLIENISIDSRTIKKGSFFFALKGANYDAHDFVQSVADLGAKGIIVSKDIKKLSNISDDFCIIRVKDTVEALGAAAKAYRNLFKDLKIAAITGSNGKTTTKELLYSILNAKEKTLANKGNFNNRIGLPLSIFELDDSYKYGVFEIGSSIFGEIDILSDILSPYGVAITNIGYSHLQEFKSLDGVYKEKKDIFKYLSKDGFIVLNKDDEFLARIDRNDFQKVIEFSIKNKTDIYADNISLDKDGVKFQLHIGKDFIDIDSNQKGEIFVKNALCAAALAYGFGFSIDDIKEGVKNFTAPKMRMEQFISQNGAIFINDAYNANPSSMKGALKTVCASYESKDIILVLGDMLELGDESPQYHKELGEFIKGQKVKAVYLLGKEMSYAMAPLKDICVYHSESADNLYDKLKELSFDSNTVVLFKGSRSMRLELIYLKFANKFN